MLNQFLRYVVLGGVFLIPFLPFIVSSTMFFPFITGKNFTFRIIVELIFAAWLILALKDVAYRPRFTFIAAATAVFLTVIAVADLMSPNVIKSFWSNFERMEGWVTLAHLFAYFLVASATLNTEKLWNRLFNTSLGVSAILGVYGLFQLAGKVTINQGGVRVDATLGNATYLAIYMLFHVFLTVIMLVRWRGAMFVKYMYGALIALQIYILYHTATRGAILGFIGGALFATILIVIFERERRTLRKVSAGILAGIVLLTGGFFAIKDTSFITNSPVLGRLASISLEEESNTRFIIWNMAWQGVKERPIFGWGQESFNNVFNKYYDPRLYDQEPWFDRVHNIVLDWMIAGGFLGFLAYLAIPLAALFYLWRRSPSLTVVEKSLFTGMLAGYGFHNLFVFDNLISYTLFFTILAYIHTINSASWPKVFVDRLSLPLSEGIRTRVLPILIIALLAGTLYVVNIKGILAARAIIGGLSQQPEGLEANLEEFNRALSYDSFGRQEIVEQLVSTASQMRNLDIDASIQTKFFERARDEITALTEDYPNDARLHLFAATFYNRYGQFNEGIIAAEKAVTLTPRKQSALFELGSSYLNTGAHDKAFTVFEEAYNLNTEYRDAAFIYAVGAIYVGKNDIVDEIMNQMFADFDAGKGGLLIDERVIRAYLSQGRLDKVISLWEGAIKRQPNNPDFHLSLAAALIQGGARERAIVEIQKVIELNPDFKEQGEFYIQEIRAGRNP